jgi:RHS repeat-associated protein
MRRAIWCGQQTTSYRTGTDDASGRDFTPKRGGTWKLAGDAAKAAPPPIEQPFRFQGQQFDEETGLHYNRFRYYDPVVGRFVSQDPIGLSGGLNTSSYAPNPLGWVDPLGLQKKKKCPCPDECPPGTMDPNKINFSQRTVTLDGPKGANTYAKDMSNNAWDWSKSGPLNIMKQMGGYVSYDNRRLMAARLSKQKCVPVREVNPSDEHPDSTTGKTWEQQMDKRMNDKRNIPRVPKGGLPNLPGG